MLDKVVVTFACLNQSAYTKSCVSSLLTSGIKPEQIVVVDNSSTDDTQQYLSTVAGINLITNKSNLGCGVAWNQGALLQQAEWTVVMNNDVKVTSNWLEGLLEAARRESLQIVCPSMIEGADDYDLEVDSRERAKLSSGHIRLGHVHAVCMLIHESVWRHVGYFRATPKLLGFEDTIFFKECRENDLRMATSGGAWIHHFGSVTQNAMRVERGLQQRDGLGNRYNYRLLGQGRLQRKIQKYSLRQSLKRYQSQELQSFGFTLHGVKPVGAPICWKVN